MDIAVATDRFGNKYSKVSKSINGATYGLSHDAKCWQLLSLPTPQHASRPWFTDVTPDEEAWMVAKRLEGYPIILPQDWMSVRGYLRFLGQEAARKTEKESLCQCQSCASEL